MYATVQELVDALTLEEKAGLCTGAEKIYQRIF
mgnify:CR=1 FL=1